MEHRFNCINGITNYIERGAAAAGQHLHNCIMYIAPWLVLT